MASVKGTFNSSQSLITPGWPMAQVAMSSPVAATQLAEGTVSAPATSTALKTAHTQSGHQSDRVD